MRCQRAVQTKGTETGLQRKAAIASHPLLATRPPVHPILQLQRQIGNRAVTQLIQAKLQVGQPGDVLEYEADRVAETVMRMPDPSVQQQAEEEERVQTQPLAAQVSPLVQRQTEEEEEALQAKEVTGQTPEVTPALEGHLQSARRSSSVTGASLRDAPFTPSMLLGLQTKAGNKAVTQLLASRLPVQRKDCCASCSKGGPCQEREGVETEDGRADAGLALQRTLGDGHDLTSPRFAGDLKLEACFDDKARLRQGDTGESVTKVQRALIDLRYDLGPAGDDGIYGPKTSSAVKAFKKAEQLGWEHMGDVGPETMRRLNELFPAGGGGDVPPGPCKIEGIASLPSGDITATLKYVPPDRGIPGQWRIGAYFDMEAEFRSDPSDPAVCGRCGEYRQKVTGVHTRDGKSTNFQDKEDPCETNPDLPEEDCVKRGGVEHRYGYHSIPFENSLFDNPDQDTGQHWKGFDEPGTGAGAWRPAKVIGIDLVFEGSLIDQCQGMSLGVGSTWRVEGKEKVPPTPPP